MRKLTERVKSSLPKKKLVIKKPFPARKMGFPAPAKKPTIKKVC